MSYKYRIIERRKLLHDDITEHYWYELERRNFLGIWINTGFVSRVGEDAEMFKTRMITKALAWADNIANSKKRKAFRKYKKVVGEFEMPAKIYDQFGL